MELTERKHLQEWLENYPQALAQGDGEELLIIQEEFDDLEPFRAACKHSVDWNQLAEPNKFLTIY